MKTTKIIQIILSLSLVFLMTLPTQAQLTKKEIKVQTKAQAKKKEVLLAGIKARATREARKEAKSLEKEGYGVHPGSLPMEKQLEASWMKQYELDENSVAVYYFADGNGVGKTQTAAELLAIETAKLKLAGQLTNEIKQIIQGKVATEQLDAETAESLTKVVSGSENVIIASLSNVRPAFKVHRRVGQNNVESMVKLYYSHEQAMIQAEKNLENKIRRNMEDEADELLKGLDEVFDK